jgi:tRNA threonylcarbamoyladenosine biosynthesis protein TsaB
MNLLVIDTSTDRAAIALAMATGGVRVATTEAGRRHGRDLIPRLKALLDAASLRAEELGAIAVGLGPGSYTGLRVGVAAAKTLSYATGAPLIGLDSLHSIARNAPPDAARISVIADAQRGELYVADLVRPARGEPPRPVADTRIEVFSSWLDRLENGIVVLGPALESARIRTAIPDACLPPDGCANYPTAEGLLEMAREAWIGGRRESPWLLEPHYLRRSAAEDQWEARAPIHPG